VATGQDLVDAGATFLGQPYSTAPGRDSPTSGHKDCSGLIAAAYLVATGRPLEANVSVTIYDLAVRYGLTISREEAVGIPGACLLIPDDPYQGWGPNGHIGFSDGQGGTVEATPPRVQRLPVGFQPWGPAACLLPGVEYFPPAPPVDTIEETSVIIAGRLQSDPSVIVAQHIGNGLLLAEFTCRVGEELYGLPPSALDYVNGTGGTGRGELPIRFVQPYVLEWTRQTQAKVLSAPPPGGHGHICLTPGDLRAVIRAELDKTRLAH
jgi:hypothetical protein